MNKFIIAAALLFSQISLAETVTPKTIAELKETSVRIMNLEMNSGGTGSIFRSYENATHILTNKHICRLIEPGGVVDYKGKQYLVTHYKKFDQHDLCLIRINANLGVNTDIAEDLAKESSKTIVSGHPSLLPHIVTVGHLSEHQDIELIVGIRACTKEEIAADPMTCAYFGGYPVVKSFDSQLVSNLIKPGNSGSAVFNKDGKIVGVVFAGSSRDFSFGYIVPQLYLLYFIQNAHRLEWVTVGTPVDDGGLSDRVFDYKKCEEAQFLRALKFKKIRDLCESLSDTMIWSK